MREYSGKYLLKETRSAGSENSGLPNSTLDEPGRPTATVSSISPSTRPESCGLDPAVGLYNQGRVNGQEGGQEKKSKNQSESTHALKGNSKPSFHRTIKGQTRDWSLGPEEKAKLPYYLSTGPPSLPDH